MKQISCKYWFFIFIIGCTQSLSKNDIRDSLKKSLNVEIPSNFKINENFNEPAIGDFVIHYSINLFPKDFETLLDSARQKNKYEKINSIYQFSIPIKENEQIHILFDTLKFEVRYTHAEI
jgi:hypothetical protein